jgi:hypothetical protein
MAHRAHPYSQTQTQIPIFKKTNLKRQETNENSKPNRLNKNITVNYDFQSYSNPMPNHVYPTLLQDNRNTELKSILKNKTNIQQTTSSKQTDNLKWLKENSNKKTTQKNKENNCLDLKIFTGTTKSIKFFTEMFETNENNKLKKRPSVGHYLFQLHGN